MADFKTLYHENPQVVQCLLCISTTPDAEEIYNIARSQVSDFTQTKNSMITHHDYLTIAAIFCITGILVASSTKNGKKQHHISILPYDLTWPRGVSLIGEICHEQVLAFWTWNRGVTFSTLTKTVKDREEEKMPTHDNNVSPMASSKMLAWNEDRRVADWCLHHYNYLLFTLATLALIIIITNIYYVFSWAPNHFGPLGHKWGCFSQLFNWVIVLSYLVVISLPTIETVTFPMVAVLIVILIPVMELLFWIFVGSG
ncbi:hypothetical protein DFH29DRAFT_872386 [Suillus ampliporus]|nr:hypothetical protein DFH29DRAFT_872386 [Suillus ampliporus]